MKNIIFLLCFMYCCCTFASAQSSSGTIRDTSGKLKGQHRETRELGNKATNPLLQTDTLSYDNKVFRNGIRSAEYQNRGAEDRRNPHSADPNATPNKKVPDAQRREPVK